MTAPTRNRPTDDKPDPTAIDLNAIRAEPVANRNQSWWLRNTENLIAAEACTTELVKALKEISHFQRTKCENASAEMLFMILDNKVGIALAALKVYNSIKEPTP